MRRFTYSSTKSPSLTRGRYFLLLVVGALSLSSGCREMAGKKKNKSPTAVDTDKKKSSKSEDKAENNKAGVEPSGS